MTAITITNAGRTLFRDSLSGATVALIKYVALGTSSLAPAATDTTLGAEVFRKTVTTFTNGTSNEVLISMYLAPSDAINVNITEIGFFGGSSATNKTNTGILLAHGLYTHTKSGIESIQFTLDFTIS